MSRIPEQCIDCPELDKVLRRPAKNFVQCIEDATGEKVVVYGGNISDDNLGMPSFVQLASGELVSQDMVRDIWHTIEDDYRQINNDITELVTDCPGIQIKQPPYTICGKVALGGQVTHE